MDELQKIIQANILELMIQSGASMRQVSTDINCSESYIQKILSGTFTPTLEKLVDIAAYFNVPVTALLETETTISPKIHEIDALLVNLDDGALDAVLEIVKRIVPENIDIK